jgi:nifR3 family TIM-barrel protein
MREVIAATVRGAAGQPVTVKTRLGLDEEHMTWQDTVDVAAGEGARWISVHARTAAQLYSGQARWDILGEIKQRATIPVLGNGDIWEPFDALRMMRQTGCDGVVIGRGCLGRPWLFRELAEVFDGREPADPPRLGEVLRILQEHAELLVDFFGEQKGVLELRKWCSWYTKGFPGASVVRGGLQNIESLDQMRGYLAQLDPALPFPQRALRVTRAKRGGSQDKVALPDGWLDLGAQEAVEQRGGRA